MPGFKRKKLPLWGVEDILYANLSDTPSTWAELGLGGSFPFISYTEAQSLTDPQKAQARSNIGATGSSHDAITLGSSQNGLSLSGQELSLALATTEASGAMSITDKTKLLGGNVSANDGVSFTGTGTGRLLSPGNIAFKVDATVLRNSGEQIDLGLKRVRRFGVNDGSTIGVVRRYEIDAGTLHSLELCNTQNVDDTDGEVQWFYRYTSNTGFGASKTRDMIGFARGAVTILGGRKMPSTYYATIATDEGTNAGTPSYRYPLRQYAYGMSQFEAGIIVGTDENRVSKIDSDTKLFVEGGIKTTHPSGGTEAPVLMGDYTVVADSASDIRWRVKVGDKVIDLLGVEVI